MSDNIIIIGGGVSGITTGLTLQLLGYETEIITNKTVADTDKASHPEFASLFPSASVIPHSVYSNRLKELFISSQSFFYRLRKLTFPGVTIHKHYEVFEFNLEQPEYCNWMFNFQSLDEQENGSVPRRSEDIDLQGWVFDCIFADWSLYMPTLQKMYERSGGNITKKELSAVDVSTLQAETIVNCSGTGAPTLFEDPSPLQLIMRGHLLHKAEAPIIRDSNGEIISYNYTPEASVYADADGEPCDVYCYPRKDGWVLGGSRQAGLLNEQYFNTDSENPSYNIDGNSFPKQIIDLNSQILRNSYGEQLASSDELTLSVGYRYIRNRKNGLRLESETVDSKKVIHNYGHGGAGVTLSWGCALDIAERICSLDAVEISDKLLEEIDEDLQIE